MLLDLPVIFCTQSTLLFLATPYSSDFRKQILITHAFLHAPTPYSLHTPTSPTQRRQNALLVFHRDISSVTLAMLTAQMPPSHHFPPSTLPDESESLVLPRGLLFCACDGYWDRSNYTFVHISESGNRRISLNLVNPGYEGAKAALFCLKRNEVGLYRTRISLITHCRLCFVFQCVRFVSIMRLCCCFLYCHLCTTPDSKSRRRGVPTSTFSPHYLTVLQQVFTSNFCTL